jgi:hypothetical protein
MPSVMVMVSVRITREVISRSALLTAPLGRDGRPGPFETVLERLTPGKLVIEDVTEGEGAALEWHAETLTEGNAAEDSLVRDRQGAVAACCKLTVRIKDVFERTLMGGEFLVKTNVEEKPISVPFKVVRR